MKRREYKYIPTKWKQEEFYSPALWMNRIIGRLELTPAHRDVFAIVYGYTLSEGGAGEFFGSLAHLEALTMYSRATVQKALVELEEKKLIQKEVRSNQLTPAYRANLETVEQMKDAALQTDMMEESADKAAGQRRLDEARHRSRKRTTPKLDPHTVY